MIIFSIFTMLSGIHPMEGLKPQNMCRMPVLSPNKGGKLKNEEKKSYGVNVKVFQLSCATAWREVHHPPDTKLCEDFSYLGCCSLLKGAMV